MATEYICALKASGGDYSLVSSWEAAQQCDLTNALVFNYTGIVGTVSGAVTGTTSLATGIVTKATVSGQVLIHTIVGTFAAGETLQVDGSNYLILSNAGDSAISVLECFNDWPTGLLDGYTISGWVTSATSFLIMRATGNNKHSGKFGTGFLLSGAGKYCLQNTTAKLLLQGVELYNTGDGSGATLNISGTFGSVVEDCLLSIGSYGAYGSCLSIGGDVLAANNIIKGERSVIKGVTGNVKLYNNTIISTNTANTVFGLYNYYTNFDARNNVFSIANGIGVLKEGGSIIGSNNASNDATVSTLGIGTVTGITNADFTDYANGDYSIPITSQMYDQGTPIAGLTTDILGNPRA